MNGSEEKFVSKWEKTRKRGIYRFIIIRGALLFGISMFIVMHFILPKQLNLSLERIIISFAIWIIVGSIFGWWMWQFLEKSYLNLTNNEASLLQKALLDGSDVTEVLKTNEYSNSFIYGPIIDRIIAAICLALCALCIWSLFLANIQNVVLLLNILGAFFFGWMGLISISEKCRAFGFWLIKAVGYIVLLVGVIYLLSIIPVSVAIILGSVIIGFFIYNGLKKKHDVDK